MNNDKAIVNKPMSLTVISLKPVKIIIKSKCMLINKLINFNFHLVHSKIPKTNSINPSR